MIDKVFYFLSFLAVLSALMVVFSKNPVHSVLYLILTFFAIAGHYILLNAQFLAVVHIIVYAGAIMVLFLFVIMFLNLNADSEPSHSFLYKLIGVLLSGGLLVLFVGAFRKLDMQYSQWPQTDIGLIKNLGMVLFNEFTLPFEIISILLLAAMVGAIVLGKKATAVEE
jgi:NADH-quinone oxidoreductase subunit J